MTLTKLEQETVVLYNNEESTATVYTHDEKLKKKLRKLAVSYPDKVVFQEENACGGVTYVVPKSCVIIHEPYSEERRKKASERAKTAGYKPPNRDTVSKN